MIRCVVLTNTTDVYVYYIVCCCVIVHEIIWIKLKPD